MEKEVKAVLVIFIFLFAVGALFDLSGCDEKVDTHKYKLNSGEVVTCNGSSGNSCGLYLYKCSNGKTYYCQTNVTSIKGE